jgi:putative sigma-54 modulation protein
MSLEVAIFPKNMEITDRINEYVDKKISKLDRYLGDIEETRVELAYEKSARNPSDRQVAQITIRGRGYILRTEERSDDIFSAIDLALEKMQRKIERFKGKRARSRGEGVSIADLSVEDRAGLEETEEPPVVARRKSFVLTPMDEMEAIEQMSHLGHENFFVFFNANTNAVNVLYRRRNGSYGLIEPRIG